MAVNAKTIQAKANLVSGHASYLEDGGEKFTVVQTKYLNDLLSAIMDLED